MDFQDFITFSFRVKELGAENPELKSGNDAEDNDLALLCTSNVSLSLFLTSANGNVYYVNGI